MSNNDPIEILLVEDNAGDARLALEALKEGKGCATTCTTSRTALRR